MPLRIKLVAALLALVVIALAVISMVGLAQFRSYLQDRTDVQLRSLSAQVGDSSGIGGLRSPRSSSRVTPSSCVTPRGSRYRVAPGVPAQAT